MHSITSTSAKLVYLSLHTYFSNIGAIKTISSSYNAAFNTVTALLTTVTPTMTTQRLSPSNSTLCLITSILSSSVNATVSSYHSSTLSLYEISLLYLTLFNFYLILFFTENRFFHIKYSDCDCHSLNSSQIPSLLPIHSNPNPFLLSLIRKQTSINNNNMIIIIIIKIKPNKPVQDNINKQAEKQRTKEKTTGNIYRCMDIHTGTHRNFIKTPKLEIIIYKQMTNKKSGK